MQKEFGLQYFIKRAQVLKAYRTLLRATKSADNNELRQDVRSQITNEFRRNKALVDPVAIKGSILEAQRSIDKVKEICTPKAVDSINEDKDNNNKESNIPTSHSWMASDDEDDKRGRVGSGWPWES